jgi:hypothetical protein
VKLPDIGLGGPAGAKGHDDSEGHFDAIEVGANDHRVATDVAPTRGHETGPRDGATVGPTDAPGGAITRVQRGATDVDVAPGHEGLPDAELEGHKMATGERLWVAARYWGRQAWAGAKSKAASPSGLYHTQPESLAQHDERIARHEWVPEGYEGKWLEPLGVAYHQTFGKFGKATGYAWAWVWDRPLAFFPLFILVIIATILIRYS